MKSLLVVALCCAFSFLNEAEKSFPVLKGETLDGRQLTLPSDCAGKKTVIGVAYSEKAQDALISWHEPMYDKFVAKVGMFDSQYDVNLFFVPMFIGLKQSLYESTLKKLRADNRKDLYPYVLFYKGELEPYGSTLNLNDKSMPYFFVLDEKGKIIGNFSGNFSEKKMEDLEAVLDK
jgi:hypothetical protein